MKIRLQISSLNLIVFCLEILISINLINNKEFHPLKMGTLIKRKVPVIGILAFYDRYNNTISMIENSYVYWLNSGGALTTPIYPWIDDIELDKTINEVNAVLFPHVDRLGVSFNLTNEYEQSAKRIYEKIKRYNENDKDNKYVPLLGIGNGLDLIQILEANSTDIVTDFSKVGINNTDNSTNISKSDSFLHSMEVLISDVRRIRMFHYFDGRDLLNLKTKMVLPRYCNSGINPTEYVKSSQLKNMFKVVGIGVGKDSTQNRNETFKNFISMVEAYRYPIYGISFDPARYLFSKINDEDILEYSNEAVTISQKILNFFIKEAFENLYRKVSKGVSQILTVVNNNKLINATTNTTTDSIIINNTFINTDYFDKSFKGIDINKVLPKKQNETTITAGGSYISDFDGYFYTYINDHKIKIEINNNNTQTSILSNASEMNTTIINNQLTNSTLSLNNSTNTNTTKKKKKKKKKPKKTAEEVVN
jgi:hypothetical protein